MRKLRNKMDNVATMGMVKAEKIKTRVFDIFAQKNGEGFVDSALKILISVVIGSLLLAGLYMLFKDSLLPELESRIMSIFDYKG